MHSLYSRFCAGLLAGLILLSGCTVPSQPRPASQGPRLENVSGELAVHFINVGQGDCTLVVFPNGKRLLVDCGTSGGPFNATRVRNVIRSQLNPADPKIDLVVITHPDRDHYNKLADVLGAPGAPQIKVGKVMYSGAISEYDEDEVDDWLSAFPANQRIVVSGQTYNTYPPKDLPGFEGNAVVLAANVTATKSVTNARSIVIKITHGDFDVMLTGDATTDTDKKILALYPGAKRAFLDVEVWKAAHHGSWATATHNTDWADAVKPEVVVFSASDVNTYGHPNLNLAEKFINYTQTAADHDITFWTNSDTRASAAKVQPYRTEAMYLTATNGDITVKSDGLTWTTTFTNH